MPTFYVEFKTTAHTKSKRGKTITNFLGRYYRVDQLSYHTALYASAPVRDCLIKQDGNPWVLNRLSKNPFYGVEGYVPLPELTEEYYGLYYEAAYDYEYMVIEGTRLMELKGESMAGGYGAYVRNVQTGETSFASPSGEFYTHTQIEAALAAIHKRSPNYDPTDSFVWHPLLFPYDRSSGEPRVNMADYILSNNILAFPLSFNSREGYERQIEWLMKMEGLA